MSDQYEPSYYEIALTGRQVLVAFVVLLVCLVAAFFSGVWMGRGGGDAEERPVEIAREDGGEGEDLQELSFFEEQPMERPRDLEEVAKSPRPDTTLLEDVDGRTRRDPPPEDPPAGAEAEIAEPPDETADAPPPARPERGRTKAPAGPLSTGDVVIQVFSSAEEPKAREVLSRLQENGFRAFLSPLTDGGRTLYRVRVGPFERRSDAEAMAERLRRSMNLETWITQ